jgi:6-phosphogluconolactonase (cycloisomerase 2 family)
MHRRRHRAALAAAVVVCSSASITLAQSIQPAVFVSNNVGDAVTSFTVNPDGSLNRIAAFPSGDGPQTVSLSSDGRWLAVANGTASTTVEELRIFQVNPDATLTQRLLTTVPDSPLDVQWMAGNVLAVAHTALSGSNEARTFTWDPTVNTLTPVDAEPTGSFTSRLHYSPTRSVLYANNTGSGAGINVFSAAPNGQLTFIEREPVSFAVDMAATHNGNFLYGAGGISGDGNRIYAYTVAPDGSLEPHPSFSFTSPGESPKDIAFSGDDRILIAGHGTDATVQTFFIDPVTGSLTHSGFFFDVGTQGNLGDIQTLGNLLFVTHEASDTSGPPGILSFRINPDGSLTQNGPILDTLGARPEYIATWQGIPEPGMLGVIGAGALMLMRRKRA